MLWNCSDCDYRSISNDEVEIRIPQIAERCCVDGSDWWQGYNPIAGKISSVIHDGIKISNNKTLNACKFFNMMGKTLRNHKVYTYIDYSTSTDNTYLDKDEWYNQLIPLGENKIDTVSVKWDSGYYIIRAKMNSLNSIAQLNTAKYITFTFVFNRNTGLCYTTDLETALKDVTSDKLPGYKPYMWSKYKNERI